MGLMEGKPVIAIAPRLSTIARMDRLIVLDQGRIVEQGSHDELLKHDGHYARLWRHQSGGFLGNEPVPDDLTTEPVDEAEADEAKHELLSEPGTDDAPIASHA